MCGCFVRNGYAVYLYWGLVADAEDSVLEPLLFCYLFGDAGFAEPWCAPLS